MFLYQVLLPVVIVFMLVVGFVVDAYSVFLKVAVADGLGESLAMANLVQYLARISNVLVVFFLSFAFETGRLESDVASLFMLASGLGVFSVIILLYAKRACDLVTYGLLPVLCIPFPMLSRKLVWQDLRLFDPKQLKLVVTSATTNLMIVLAMFVPFGIATIYPEMRMTSVYVGQLVNFLATFLFFSLQEPVSMRLVDEDAYQLAGAALLWGRVASYFLASVIFALFYWS